MTVTVFFLKKKLSNICPEKQDQLFTSNLGATCFEEKKENPHSQ